MNIGYISSDKYAPYLGVSLFSLLDHNRDADEINVYIFDVSISDINKKHIETIVDKYARSVTFVSKNDEMEKIVEEEGLSAFCGTSSTYVKIFPELFFEGVDRILMIDCDTIINSSLQELYDTDLRDRYVGAVPEITAYYFSSEYKEIIHRNQFYYNTGVLLWNLKKMRDDNFHQRLIDAFNSFGKPLKLADQSLLNLTIDDSDVVPLNMKYNFNNNLNFIFKGIRRSVMEQYEFRGLGIIEANYYKPIKAKYISIIHFLGSFRPWIKWKNPPLRKYFLKYWKRSPWKNDKFESYLDEMIAYKLSLDPQAFVGKKFVGRIYAAMIAFMERYMPDTLKSLKQIKNTRRR